MRRSVLSLVAALALMLPLAAAAISPDEMLDDPLLEERARALSQELRCVVCQNQSIDDSDADLAKDLRVIVREQLLAGQNEEQIKSYLVDRYGEFILFRPRFSLQTLMLWGGPFLMLLLVFVGGFWFYRSRSKSVAALSKEEEAELQSILSDDKEARP